MTPEHALLTEIRDLLRRLVDRTEGQEIDRRWGEIAKRACRCEAEGKVYCPAHGEGKG